MRPDRSASSTAGGGRDGVPERIGAGRIAARLVPKPDFCIAAGLALCVAYGLAIAGPRSGASSREAPLHASRIEGLAVSPDSRAAASASRDGTLKVWDIATLRQIGKAVASVGGFACAAYAPRGDALVAGGIGGDLLLVEGGVIRILRASSACGVAVRAVAFAPDGATVAAGSDDGSVGVWDLESGRVKYALAGHVRAAPGPDFAAGAEPPISVQGLAFAPDGRTLASVGVDGQVILWDTSSGRARARIPGDCGPLWSVAFSPDGREIALGGSRGITLLDVEGDRPRRHTGVAGRVTSIQYHPGGTILGSAGFEGVDLWDVSGEPVRLRRLDSKGERVKALAISPDGTRIVAGTSGGVVLSWNLAE